MDKSKQKPGRPKGLWKIEWEQATGLKTCWETYYKRRNIYGQNHIEAIDPFESTKSYSGAKRIHTKRLVRTLRNNYFEN